MQKLHTRSRTCRHGWLVFILLLAPLMLLAGQKMEMSLTPWLAVNDNVMGGVSSGLMTKTEEGLRFEGRLSLENNGGFASVRWPVEGGLPGVTAVRIKVRGDGRRYQLRMRHGQRFDGVSWRAEFDTGNDWKIIEFRLEDFDPVFRGYKVPNAGPVVASEIGQLGFLLADGIAGDFALEISAIEFVPRK